MPQQAQQHQGETPMLSPVPASKALKPWMGVLIVLGALVLGWLLISMVLVVIVLAVGPDGISEFFSWLLDSIQTFLVGGG